MSDWSKKLSAYLLAVAVVVGGYFAGLPAEVNGAVITLTIAYLGSQGFVDLAGVLKGTKQP